MHLHCFGAVIAFWRLKNGQTELVGGLGMSSGNGFLLQSRFETRHLFQGASKNGFDKRAGFGRLHLHLFCICIISHQSCILLSISQGFCCCISATCGPQQSPCLRRTWRMRCHNGAVLGRLLFLGDPLYPSSIESNIRHVCRELPVGSVGDVGFL